MKKTTKISLIFSLLLPTLLSAQTLKEFDLQEMNEQQIPLFVDHPNEAAYIFYTAINGLTIVSSTGGVVSSQQEATKLTVFLRPERQVLTIKAPGYIEKKIAVESVSAKQAKFFSLNPKEEKYISEKGSYQINSDPSGVLLTIEGYPGFKEFTPFELKDYEARKYKITLAKPGFYTLDTLIEIRPGMRQSSLYKIKSQSGILSLKAPLNVTVKINNLSVEVGQDYVNQKLKDGVYILDVTDSRFEPYHETVTVGSGETKLLELPLVKRVGVLQVDHSDAFEVLVNGTTYSKKEGILSIEFYEGTYQAKVKRSGFAPEELSFTIQKGKIVTWAPAFKPILVQVKLTTEPEGASVVLIRNGERKVLGFTPIDDQIAVGEVEFLITGDGFKEYKFKETLEEGKPVTKKIDLANPNVNLSAQTTERTKEGSLKEFDLQEIREQQIPLFIDHPNEATFIFYTAISGLTIGSNTGGVVATQQEATKLTIFLRPERQVLTIKAPGFLEKKIQLETVSAKQAKFFKLNPKEEKYFSELGSVLINSVPSGAFFTIDGIPDFAQYTPYELKEYESRTYKIKLELHDYISLDTTLIIKKGIKQTKTYFLETKNKRNTENESTVTDIDGNIYNTITIGSQVWMVENLKTTRYNNGDPIPNVKDRNDWRNLKTGAYCNYDNNPWGPTTYYTLYNWYAVNDSRKIAPTGWHVATDAEWTTLIKFYGGKPFAGSKMKSKTVWNQDGGGSGDYSFTALPGGYRDGGGNFDRIGYYGYWWCASEEGTSNAIYKLMASSSNVVFSDYYDKGYGLSVRCIRD